MTPFARWLAVLVGAAGMVVAVAALVREVVLAAEPTLQWRAAPWWGELTGRASWALTAAAAGTAVVAIVLIVLAVRQLGEPRERRRLLEFGGADGQARLDVQALERALARSLQAGLAGARTGRITLSRRGDGWWARLEVAAAPRDLIGLQARAFERMAADLERLGGMRLEGVDVVVAGVLGAAPKVAAARKEDLGMTRSS